MFDPYAARHRSRRSTARPARLVFLSSLSLLVSLAGSALDAQQTIGGCQVLPDSNVWNTPVIGLPVHADSDAYLTTIGKTTGLHMDSYNFV